MTQENKGIPFLYFYPGTTVKCGFKLVSYKFANGRFVSKEKTVEGEGTVICTTINTDHLDPCDVQRPKAINLWVKLGKYYLKYDIKNLLSTNNNLPGNSCSFDSSAITVEVFGKGINKDATYEPILNVITAFSKILWTKDQQCIDAADSEVYLHPKFDRNNNYQLSRLRVVVLHTLESSTLFNDPSISVSEHCIDEFIIDYRYNGYDYTLLPSLGLFIPEANKKITTADVFKVFKHLYQPTIVNNPDIEAEYVKRCEILKNSNLNDSLFKQCKDFITNIFSNFVIV